MIVKFEKKRINIPLKKVSWLRKFTGLMFRPSKTMNLLFEFSKNEMKNIHSLFVFFDFLAIWLDNQDRVLKVDKVRPFTLLIEPPKNTRKLIEVPNNKGNRNILDFFVDKKRKV